MAENAYEAMQQDRIAFLLERNRSLSKSLVGLSRQFLRQCDKYGWNPAKLWVRMPHVDGRGFVEIKYRAAPLGRSRYTGAMNAESIPKLLGQQNQALSDFMQRCRPWRQAVERVYEQGYAFAFDHGTRFEELAFGAFHVETARRRAWCWIARSEEKRIEMELAGVM